MRFGNKLTDVSVAIDILDRFLITFIERSNMLQGIPPFYAYSLDEPLAIDSGKLKIENIIKDSETGEIGFFKML